MSRIFRVAKDGLVSCLRRNRKLRLEQPDGSVAEGHWRIHRRADRLLPVGRHGVRYCGDASMCDMDRLNEVESAVARSGLYVHICDRFEYLHLSVAKPNRAEVLRVL